jgi:hypothetical protein
MEMEFVLLYLGNGILVYNFALLELTIKSSLQSMMNPYVILTNGKYDNVEHSVFPIWHFRNQILLRYSID